MIPTAYLKGYETARAFDPATADKYIKHTMIGDDELDPVMNELHALSPADLHRFIKAGIEQETDVLRKAPKIMRDFFEKADSYVPPWVDFGSFNPGRRAFILT